MTVKSADVQVGKCFITSNKQVRRVTEITDDDRVNYQARGSRYSGETDWFFVLGKDQLPSREQFAARVDRQVDCKWDQRYPEPKAATENKPVKTSTKRKAPKKQKK